MQIAIPRPILPGSLERMGRGMRDATGRSGNWGGKDMFQTQRIVIAPAILCTRGTADLLDANPL
jgi:hypothetical protein